MPHRLAAPVALTVVLAAVAPAAPVPAPPPTDRHGDVLGPGVVARFGTVRLRMTANAWHFTADGKLLVGVGRSSARVFDRATGRLLHALDPGPGFITASVLNPDGKTLYTLHGKRIVASDLETGRCEVFRDGEIYMAHHAQLAVSTDGKVLAVADPDNQATRPDDRRKGYVRLIDTATRKDVFYSDKFRIDGQGLALSPDGSLFSLGLYEGFVVYDAKAGKETFRLKRASSLYAQVAFAPDGKSLATFGTHAEYGFIEIRDPRSGKVTAVPEYKFGHAPSFRFSPDGSELWCVSDKPPIALDVAGKKPARPLVPGLTEENPGGIISPDGKWLVIAGRIREVATGRDVTPAPDNDSYLWAVPSSDGTRVATLGWDALVVWDAKTGKPVASAEGKNFGPELRWTADGARVTARHGTDAGWWDAKTGKRLRTLKVGPEPLGVVSVRGDTVFTTTWEYEAPPLEFALDAATGKKSDWSGPDPQTSHWEDHVSPDGTRHVGWIDGHKRGIRYALFGLGNRVVLSFWNEQSVFAFARDGKTLVGAGKAGVRVWDAATGKVIGPDPAPAPDEALVRGHAEQVAVSPDGKLAAVTLLEYVETRQPGGHVDEIYTGRVLLRLYDLKSGKLWLDAGRFDTLDRVVFMPDGKHLLVVRHGYAEVIDPEAARR
jgi:WD40 repeat protein